MTRSFLVTFALWLGLVTACLAGAPDASDRLILVMASDPSINRPDLRGARSGAYRPSRRYPGVPSDVVRAMRDLAEDYSLKYVDAWPMRSLGVHCVVFEASTEAGIDALVANLSADSRVESAQVMNRFEVLGESSGAGEDPYRKMQRSFDELGIADAQRWATGRGVRVAVVDTGVAASHPDLKGQVVERRDFVGGEAPGDRHGTAVAGLIAAKSGNQVGIVGIAPGAHLLALRACAEQEAGGRGRCTTFDLARAIDYALGAEANVLNLSLGGPQDHLLERLLGHAMAQHVIVVAAAGEGGVAFPSAMEGVIAVGGDKGPAQSGSLIVPATDVLSLAPPDGYDYFSGSSIAAAQVTGIVALMLERAPKLATADVRRVLLSSAEDAVRPVVHACAAVAAVGRGVDCASR